MSNLSAPSVEEPIYDCAATVIVGGYVPGANVEIFADPPGATPAVKIGGGVSNSASGQVFGVPAANMVAGTKITATQTYGGDTSPTSVDVTVQTPLSVDAPIITAPLFECARCVRVDGLLPGAKAQVRDAGTTLGESNAASAAVKVGASPPLLPGHTITARQVHCGNPGPDSPGLVVASAKEQKLKLAAPEIKGPLFACTPSVVVGGCMPSCQVELLVNGNPADNTCAAGTVVRLAVAGGLVDGTSITARQTLCGGALQSSPSAAVTVQPAANLPKPAIWPPLYEGDISVLVGMTIDGEVVTIEADATQVGMGGTGGGNASLNVDPPLVAGQKVVATVELCSVKKSSLPVPVLPAPKTVPPPKIVKPLVACGLLVNVSGCKPGAEVRVFATSGPNTVLLGVKKTLTSTTTVAVTPPLKAGWDVHATQKVGATTSGPSVAVPVSAPPALPAPALVKPIFACARCVRVEQTLVGAHVDVFQNGIWVGSGDASGAETTVHVYPGLTAGATLTVTQAVCGKASQAGKATVTGGPEKVPTPQLQPAFAGKSYVEATALVPGATVEVEEISVYNQVIGESCVTGAAQAVGVNLPLFAGAKLRARQKLCTPSSFSPTIIVAQPEEWPLGPGPFKAGLRLVADVPVSAAITFMGGAQGPCAGAPDDMHHFDRPGANKAVIYYPAAADGANKPLAAGGPFHVLVYGHARRFPSCIADWQACPAAPTETDDDSEQLSGILSHLARWGFVSIAADFSWLAPEFAMDNWVQALADAASYMIAENGKPGSPFQNQLKTATLSLMGHSTGGFAAIELATGGQLSVDALGLLAPAGDDASVVNLAPKPVMVVHGSKDVGTNGDNGHSLDVYAAAAPKKHLVDIDGANHFGFTDSLCIQGDNTSTIGQADQQEIAKAYLTAFFRRYVTNAPDLDDYLSGVRPVEELGAFIITVSAQL